MQELHLQDFRIFIKRMQGHPSLTHLAGCRPSPARAQSPKPRAQTPDQSQSPEPRAQSPKPRAQTGDRSPEPKPQAGRIVAVWSSALPSGWSRSRGAFVEPLLTSIYIYIVLLSIKGGTLKYMSAFVLRENPSTVVGPVPQICRACEDAVLGAP